jgi:uncharacterized membrane protein
LSDTFARDFKRFFFRGLAAVLPTVVTIAIIVWVFAKVQEYAGQYINIGVMALVAAGQAVFDGGAGPFRQRFQVHFDRVDDWWEAWHLGWVGFVFAIIAVYIFGRFVASYVGRTLWRLLEMTFHRLPVIKQIYPHIKQVTDFLFSERKIEFSNVVAVEYPRRGVWALGLATSGGMRTIQEAVGEECVTVFIPTSPTPVTGYTITVSRSEVIDLPLTIDEALKFTISGGVILPLGQDPRAAVVARNREKLSSPPPEKEQEKPT